MRGTMKASKGGRYEREFAKALSIWWTKGERDDVFWRVGGSGGRAKVRGNKGKQTAGQHADICATDPIGDPLTRFATIELKCGYNDVSPFTILSSAEKTKLSDWQRQVELAAKQSGAVTWMIVHKRDFKPAVVYIPQAGLDSLLDVGCDLMGHTPQLMYVPGPTTVQHRMVDRVVTAFKFSTFLSVVTPEHIMDVIR